MPPVRPAAVAGYFYPADPIELADAVRDMLGQVQAPPASHPPKVIIVPHAGYVYSGPFTATRIVDYRLTIAEQPDFTPDLSWTIEPPHIYFGPLIRWNYPALITEVSPSGNGCSVSAINYSPLVYLDDDNSPP